MSDSLLPHSATPQELAIEAATARIADVPIRAREMWNPDTCPAEFLPWLAWAWSVDDWQASWTEEQKRQVLRDAYFVHRHKGTRGAVKRSIASLGYGAEIVEWFQESPQGTPYTFRVSVEVSGVGVGAGFYLQMQRLINTAKNVRSHLAGMDITASIDGSLYVAAAVISGHEFELLPQV